MNSNQPVLSSESVSAYTRIYIVHDETIGRLDWAKWDVTWYPPSVRSRYIPLVGWFRLKQWSATASWFGLPQNRNARSYMAGIESVETAKEKLSNALLAAKAGTVELCRGYPPPCRWEASSVPSMALREADAFRRRSGWVGTCWNSNENGGFYPTRLMGIWGKNGVSPVWHVASTSWDFFSTFFDMFRCKRSW